MESDLNRYTPLTDVNKPQFSKITFGSFSDDSAAPGDRAIVQLSNGEQVRLNIDAIIPPYIYGEVLDFGQINKPPRPGDKVKIEEGLIWSLSKRP